MRRGLNDAFWLEGADNMTLVDPGSSSGRAPQAPWPEPDRAIYSPTGHPRLYPPTEPSAPSWDPNAPIVPGPGRRSQDQRPQDAIEPSQSNQSNQSNQSDPSQSDPSQSDPSQSDQSQLNYPNDPNLPPAPQPPMLYSAELIIFGFVGWAWLAVREYIGNTPVLDVTVILSTLICSCISLVAVLLVPSPLAFAPFAQAYFSHALALCVLYAYGLAESIAPASPTIACNTTNATVSALYARAYFGGLPLHQAPAGVTMAYLIVVLLLSAAQTNACIPVPRKWFLRGFPQSASIFLVLHLSLYALNTPLSDPMAPFAGALIGGLGTLLVISMVDIAWVLGLFFRGAKRAPHIIQGAIEMGLVGLAAVLCNLYCAILADDQPSVPLLISFTALFLLSVLLFANELSRPQEAVPSAVPNPPPRPQPLRALNLRGFLARPRARTHEGKNK